MAMQLLIKQVTIIDPRSPFHKKKKDIWIEENKIKAIDDYIAIDQIQTLQLEDLLVSPGWVDIFAQFGEPGLEYNETLTTGSQVAIKGGYTHVFVIPNTYPILDHRSQIEYIVNRSKLLPIHIHPLGAISKNTTGKELAELFDMFDNGALAFTDGILPIQQPGLLLKALEYVKAFQGTIIQLPNDCSMGSYGLMNEGIASTQLGMLGIPMIAEEIMIQRDIELLRYTGSKLHITGVSTQKGLDYITQAKKDNLSISCSCTPYHLFFTDDALKNYHTSFKVMPPLRDITQQAYLQKAVIANQVDCIASHHLPEKQDHKSCEFDFAKWGMQSLQSTYCAVNHCIGEQLTDTQIVEMFSINPRHIFQLPPAIIQEEQEADMTFFSRTGSTTLNHKTNQSKAVNSGFWDIPLQGEVKGVYTKNHLSLNPLNY